MEDEDSSEDDSQNLDALFPFENETPGEEQPFDISLPASHSYMGNSHVPVPGRDCALEPGWQGRVAVTAHHGIVFPGETVPMLFTEDLDLFAQAIQEDKMFGMLCPDEGGVMVSSYGVLCELYEVLAPPEPPEPPEPPNQRDRETPPPPMMSFKARATLRFRCRHPPIRVTARSFRLRFMEIRVLADLNMGDPLQHVRLSSLDPLRGEDSRMLRKLRTMDATLTPWPLFVYDIFDLRRMRQIIREYFKAMALDNVPEDAVELSFWTASNLALSPRDRLSLFVVDDALLRLRMEVGFIMQTSVLCCAGCAIEIARQEFIFAMSTEGVHSNYINLGGFVHDLVTVSRVKNTRKSGAPSAEYSWFPGYAWTVTLCNICRSHVGWRFDALRRNLRPQHFYGLCRNYVQPRYAPLSPQQCAALRRSPPRLTTPLQEPEDISELEHVAPDQIDDQ